MVLVSIVLGMVMLMVGRSTTLVYSEISLQLLDGSMDEYNSSFFQLFSK